MIINKVKQVDLNTMTVSEHHALYVQSDILLIFEYFQDMRVKIYELEPAYLLSAP